MKNYLKILPLFLLLCLEHCAVKGQISASAFQQYISGSGSSVKQRVREFYSALNYKTAWIQKQNRHDLGVVFQYIQHAADFGLNNKDYNKGFIESIIKEIRKIPTLNDSLEDELTITSIVIDFYTDLSSGNAKPVFGYDGLEKVDGTNIITLLTDFIGNGKLDKLPYVLSSGIPEITALQVKLKWINRIIADSGFREITKLPLKPGSDNKDLLLKLYQLGILDSLNYNLADSSFKKTIKKGQQMFCLLVDGTIRSTLIQELNVPLAVRLHQLYLSINYYRWLNGQVSNMATVLVNIPAAYMKVYRNDSIILEMKMVVGKPSTPTPTLTSTITEVILYPYWHVPFSIATKEILPLVKAHPDYINTAGFQVLNKNGNIVNPASVNWKVLSRSNFPYTIRQSTGCDNALGLLKLNFYSPYGVYLHDTPSKFAFSMNKRYLSHGCMRMEKPMDLGHMVLDNNNIAIDTLEQKGCLRNQSPVTVPTSIRIPVIVWYNPAGTDQLGNVIFYEDIYNRFKWQ